MKKCYLQGLVLSALAATAGSAGAMDFYLAAKAFEKIMPGGAVRFRCGATSRISEGPATRLPAMRRD